MISSALFIIVAESTVIFGPMSQLGCARASSTVTCSQLVVRQMRETGRRWPSARRGRLPRAARPASAWKIALCSLSTGRIVAPRSAASSRHQRAAHDQRFFIRQRDGFLGLERGPGAPQPGAADDAGQHDVDFFGGRDLLEARWPTTSSVPMRQAVPAKAVGRPLRRWRSPSAAGIDGPGSPAASSRRWADSATARSRPSLAAITSKALVPMLPGRAEDGDAFCGVAVVVSSDAVHVGVGETRTAGDNAGTASRRSCMSQRSYGLAPLNCPRRFRTPAARRSVSFRQRPRCRQAAAHASHRQTASGQAILRRLQRIQQGETGHSRGACDG